jgi:hypothetical protein
LKSGPLAGFKGILERYRDRFHVVLSMDLIQQSVAVEVEICDVEML